jgi:integrase
MSATKLTKRVVDALPANRDAVAFDSELKGFGVRTKPGAAGADGAKRPGTKTFLIQYRNAEGRSRRVSLGQYGPLTVEEARSRAKIELGRVAAGEDIAVEREETRRALTVAALGEAYFAAAERGEVRGKRGAAKKASTLRIDQYRWAHHVLPLIGVRKARELRRADVIDFLIKAGKQAREAGYGGAGERRLKGLIGGVFSWAIERGIVETNPTHGVKVRPDGKRFVAMDAVTYRRLGRALAEAETHGEPWQAVGAIRLVALTGCRRSEIAGLRWSEVDLEGQALRLGDSKTGASIRPLGQAACGVLRGLRAQSSGELVFPSSRRRMNPSPGAAAAEKPFELPKAFTRITRSLTDARGEAVTLHGLRHAYASTANGLGYTEATVGAMIGHAARSITGRYTHALDTALIAAADRTAGEIAAHLAEGAAGPALLKMVIADFSPRDEKTARDVLDKDAFTRRLPAAARGALAKRLGAAIVFRRAKLRVEGKGVKPEQWGLDILLDDCRKAFLEAKIPAAVWTDDRGDSPFLKFVNRLRWASDAAPQPRESLKSNGVRSASIKRRSICLPRDKMRRSP